MNVCLLDVNTYAYGKGGCRQAYWAYEDTLTSFKVTAFLIITSDEFQMVWRQLLDCF